MPISAIMSNDFDMLNLGIGLMVALLVMILVAFDRLSPVLRQWLAFLRLPSAPALIPIPILTLEAKRRAARAAARRRQLDY